MTFGVPTLSIDYSGRRQVFAASANDAALYEKIYSIIKSEIKCDRELKFLSTGQQTKAGKINSGCSIVTKIVGQLTESGSRNVFGIVDWDGKTTSTERIKVLAEGSRNGIENLLFDPLLICLLMMKYRRAPSSVADISGFVRAATLDRTQLQQLVDSVQNEVFPDTTGPKHEVRYLSGATANVLIEYLIIDDHALEARLARTYPFFHKWTEGGTGKLLNAVVDEVLTEHTGFCPEEFRTLFETIANAPE